MPHTIVSTDAVTVHQAEPVTNKHKQKFWFRLVYPPMRVNWWSCPAMRLLPNLLSSVHPKKKVAQQLGSFDINPEHWERFTFYASAALPIRSI